MRRMTLAAERAGRKPSDVTLVAVSKTVNTGAVREAFDAGLRVFGESRVQEAQDKMRELAGLGVEWHMIGHLQKNKAKSAAGIFELVHSVDSAELMEALDRHAGSLGKSQRVLVQVKLAPEDVSKHGAGEAEVEAMLRRAEGLQNIVVEGLMTIPPFYDDPERGRPLYARLRELAGAFGLKELSMGMTGDFEIAIEEGATMVRVGSAIFGERQP